MALYVCYVTLLCDAQLIQPDDRPIIFVCHSLGGLVCEDALIAARQSSEARLRSILQHTRGIVFLGTPHHGAGFAKWAELLAKSIGLLKQTNPQIVAVLKNNSEVLARIQDGFHTIIRSRVQDGLQPIGIPASMKNFHWPALARSCPPIPQSSQAIFQ